MNNLEDDLARPIFEQTNKQIDAKLAPIINSIIGLELAIAHCFNILHRHQILSLKDVLRSIDKTIEGNKERVPLGTLAVLRHIRGMLENPDQYLPEALRETFRLIRGGQPEEPPQDRDQ